MLVGQVEGIPGELDTATRGSLNEVRVLGAYMVAKKQMVSIRHVLASSQFGQEQNFDRIRTYG